MRTRVGYAGGSKSQPTYRSLGDHTETFEVDFDPAQLSYAQLLELFWAAHSPTRRSASRQYRAAIFYHGEEQRRLAEESRARLEQQLGAEVTTAIEPAGTFWRAEDYHQKYYLRNDPLLLGELRRLLPDERAFTDSTAAARVNGYLGGHGTAGQLAAELEGLGLSEAGRKRLQSQVH